MSTPSMTATKNDNSSLQQRAAQLLNKLDLCLTPPQNKENTFNSRSPINGEFLANTPITPVEDVETAIQKAHDCYRQWRLVPAPKRGELIRLFGEELRQHKETLGELITLEAGKILPEGLGEVQEMIDICDFAIGLSRQLYGLTMSSERPGHRMMETWHPLGVVGLITPFNFPVAVWAWNVTLAIVCGNATVWKASEKTPLTAIACQKLFENALQKFGTAPEGLSILVHGMRDVSDTLVDHPQVALVSATGSTEMGRSVGQRLAKRFGKALLELGGNNAMILTPSANLDLAIRAITFSAIGTCGQRCTTLRRLFVHKSIKSQVFDRLKKIYETIPIGNPLTTGILCGPLVDKGSFDHMQSSLEQAKHEGGKVYGGERIYEDQFPDAYYIRPALVEMPGQTAIVKQETFAPILYIMTYETLEEALELNNEVSQGLSSCLFSQNLQDAEIFLGASGSDCGIANVNIGPSGAEIGGAFGGEKETGGGRESGSDSWRNYMRRATNTINYSDHLPLAQGIQFE